LRKIIIIIGVIVVIISLFLFFVGRTKDESQSLQNRLEKAGLTIKNGDLKKAEEIYKNIIRECKNSEDAVLAMEGLANLYYMQNQLLKAKNLYKDIINQYPENDIIRKIQKKLWQLEIDILFSGIVTENSAIYEVQPGDTLSKIARKFNTTVSLRCNDLKSDTIRPNNRLKVVTVGFSIIIDKSQNVLTLKANDEVLKIYTVSTGEDNHTPTGELKIVNKLKNPVWYKAGAIVPAESPKNILGSRWLGLSIKGYGIHGTTDPESLGKQITEGCIRMSNKDVEELFTIVPRGTKVTIVD